MQRSERGNPMHQGSPWWLYLWGGKDRKKKKRGREFAACSLNRELQNLSLGHVEFGKKRDGFKARAGGLK